MTKGRFIRGQHWRPHKPHWDKGWLEQEYLIKQRSASDIAKEEGCTENAILFWLAKHNIPKRTMSEVRRIKKWGVSGEANGMYGRRGNLHPMWKGGVPRSRPNSLYEYKVWVKAVKNRFGNKCLLCGKQSLNGERLCCHHILDWHKYPDQRYNPLNGFILCGSCHPKTHPLPRDSRGRFMSKKV